MKYNAINLSLYAICLFKFVATILCFGFGNFQFEFFSIVVFPLCLAAAYDESVAVLSVGALFVIATLWVLAIAISLIGVKCKICRTISLMLCFAVSLADFIASFIIANPFLKVMWVYISSHYIALSVASICVWIVDYVKKNTKSRLKQSI